MRSAGTFGDGGVELCVVLSVVPWGELFVALWFVFCGERLVVFCGELLVVFCGELLVAFSGERLVVFNVESRALF